MREQSLEQIATSRRRWQSRLTRAVNAIKKLDAKEQRLKKRAAAPKAERRASPVRQVAAAVTPPSPLPPAPSADTLDIPGFLDRRSDRAKEADRKRLAELNDREAAAQIRAEQA
ncbi:MAG: hypothetical protein J2P55_16685, partial [Rhizobiales bacterium]|nr:hypothetical protein [Hyphomicrobiales bacterium]